MQTVACTLSNRFLRSTQKYIFSSLVSVSGWSLQGHQPLLPHVPLRRARMSEAAHETVAADSLDVAVRHIESVVGTFTVEPMAPSHKPITLVVSGPSGVGKDSVVARLQQLRPHLHFVVTATSRPMRKNEQDGVDYHFVSRQKFEEWIAEGQLLEHAEVYGEYKGIPRQQIEEALRQGKDVVLRLDVQGAETVRRLLPDAVCVFIVASSEAELVRRLVSRKTESEGSLIKRAGTIKQECARMHDFNYVVVNEDGCLDKAALTLGSIIDAERARISQ